jgi:hypothetical protein
MTTVKQEFEIEFLEVELSKVTPGLEWVDTEPQKHKSVEVPKEYKLEIVENAVSAWHAGDYEGQLWVVKNDDVDVRAEWFVWDDSNMFGPKAKILFTCLFSVRVKALQIDEQLYFQIEAGSEPCA